jgi:hypothetical protein
MWLFHIGHTIGLAHQTSTKEDAVKPEVLASLVARPQCEELAAEHIVREHHRGRALSEILKDPYLTNRCSEEQIRRLLDRPEITRAVREDTLAARASTD